VSDLPFDPAVAGPPAERLARRLESRSTRPTLTEVLRELGRLDLAVYRAIAATPTPMLDEPLRRLSEIATRSKLWLGVAAVIAVVGGPKGRRAALTGTAALAINSAAVDLAAKLWIRRGRPDPAAAGVPVARRVQMPLSPNVPLGTRGVRLRLRRGSVAENARHRPAAQTAGGGRRLLARAHRRPLPGRRHRRVADRLVDWRRRCLFARKIELDRKTRQRGRSMRRSAAEGRYHYLIDR
jgi:hypothetical protein